LIPYLTKGSGGAGVLMNEIRARRGSSFSTLALSFGTVLTATGTSGPFVPENIDNLVIFFFGGVQGAIAPRYR